MTYEELLALAKAIKDATQIDENTAVRVGGLLENIIKHFQDDEDDIDVLSYPQLNVRVPRLERNPTLGERKQVLLFSLSRPFTAEEINLNPCVVLMRRRNFGHQVSRGISGRNKQKRSKWADTSLFNKKQVGEEHLYWNQSNELFCMDITPAINKTTTQQFKGSNSTEMTAELLVGRYTKFLAGSPDSTTLMKAALIDRSGRKKKNMIETDFSASIQSKVIHKAVFGLAIRYENPEFNALGGVVDLYNVSGTPKYLYSDPVKLMFSLQRQEGRNLTASVTVLG